MASSRGKRVTVAVALKRVAWVVAFRVNHGRASRAGGFFEPDHYRGVARDAGLHAAGRLFSQLAPFLHYLLFGFRRKLAPAPGYDHQRAVATFPYRGELRLSPLEAYVLFGRFAGGEYFAPDSASPAPVSLPVEAANSTALVVHAFHEREFRFIMSRVAALRPRPDVYVTTSWPAERARSACREISVEPLRILAGPNRGRDVAPFCALLNAGLLDLYDVVGKVHTKRSVHRADGEVWFRGSVEGLLAPDAASESIRLLSADEGKTGVVAPEGCVATDPTGRANIRYLAALCGRQVWRSDARAPAYHFPRGTMFWARAAALRDVASLGLTYADFEAEAGQLDGTLAHAVERAIGVFCHQRGYTMLDTTEVKAPDRRPGLQAAGSDGAA